MINHKEITLAIMTIVGATFMFGCGLDSEFNPSYLVGYGADNGFIPASRDYYGLENNTITKISGRQFDNLSYLDEYEYYKPTYYSYSCFVQGESVEDWWWQQSEYNDIQTDLTSWADLIEQMDIGSDYKKAETSHYGEIFLDVYVEELPPYTILTSSILHNAQAVSSGNIEGKGGDVLSTKEAVFKGRKMISDETFTPRDHCSRWVYHLKGTPGE